MYQYLYLKYFRRVSYPALPSSATFSSLMYTPITESTRAILFTVICKITVGISYS